MLFYKEEYISDIIDTAILG